MLLRLYNDDSPLRDSSKDRFLQTKTTDTSKVEGMEDTGMADGDLEEATKDENEPEVDLMNAEPVSAGEDGEENIGTAGLAGSDATAGGAVGKGVGAKEENLGTSVDGAVDTSGQGGG